MFGSWACAGSLSKLGWFRSHVSQWPDKKLMVFCVRASPANNPEIRQFLEKNFQTPDMEGVEAFYCPGGFRYESMPLPSRLMMKMFTKALGAKKDKTEAEQEMLKMVSSSYDISDRKYIAPILERLQGQCAAEEMTTKERKPCGM